MKIHRVTAWAVHLPNADGPYWMSGNRVTTGMDTVVVRVMSDDGTFGIGESGCVGVTWDAHDPHTQVTGVAKLASAVLGADPQSPPAVHRCMTAAMTGHPYVKAPIDMAVWDLAARAAGVPVWKLLGGDGPEPTPLYRPVQGASPELSVAKAHERLAQGYRRLQVKVGDDPIGDAARVLAVREAVGDDVVIFADANCGFSVSAARRFVRALGTDGAGIFLEQPCPTLTDCAQLRDSWTGPMVMDETIVSLAALLEAKRLGVADGVTIKLTRVGGITPARVIRDAAVEMGIGVTVEDASGCDLADTAFAHMNASTPARLRVHSVDFNSWVTLNHVIGASPRDGSFLRPQAEAPGFGLTLNEGLLGTPFVDVQSR